MGTPEEYSTRNVSNSLSIVLADKLLAFGYIIYWPSVSAVQTLDGWYYQWNTAYASYAADSTFMAAWNNAKGLLSLVDHLPTEPRFVERPITVVGTIPQSEVLIPALSLEIGSAVEIYNAEIGSDLKWWNRHLLVEGYVRDRNEAAEFADKLGIWFKGDTTYDISDQDAGSFAAIGDVQVLDTVVEYEIHTEGSIQETYHVICNARLEYVA